MRRRRGIFKYPADVWPVLVVTAVVGLSFVPFVVDMPLWALAGYWVFMLWARSFGPYAQHNHAHLPAFENRFLNRVFDTLLTQTTGYPTALWELHHNRGHHRHFLTPEKDVATVLDLETGKVVSQWWYALRGNLTIVRDSLRIDREEVAAGRRSLRGKLFTEFAIQTAITIALLAWDPLLTFAFFIVPNATMSWFIWWESYPHHLQVPGTNIYDGSVTVTGKWFNFLNFNIGHHTAHHEKPTLHWSLLPGRTEKIREKIPEVCIRPDTGPGLLPPQGEPVLQAGRKAA